MPRVCLAISFASLLAAWPIFAFAQSPMYDSSDGCTGAWQEQFGATFLLLDCDPGFVTQHDRVYIYSRDPVDQSAPWKTQLNFENSVWIFDAGATSRPSLIIEFRRDRDALVADIFDDVSGDGELRYGLERGIPRSIESRFPSVSVIAPEGWWVRDGLVNFNLRVVTDGPILAAYHAYVFADYTRNDGVPDIISYIHDTNANGRPDWQITQASPPISEYDGIYRTLVMVNTVDNEVPLTHYIFWPHLGHDQANGAEDLRGLREPLGNIDDASFGLVKGYNSTYPPIQVNWASKSIAVVGEFVASRGRPNNWFTYSLLRFGQDGKVAANFENPFAFYNLSGVNDGYPDLIIRDGSSIQDDPFFDNGIREPFHQIRFTWDQTHTHSLSYLVNLAGRRPMPSTVTLGDGVALRTVAYEEFPRWVVENSWEAANFVATEVKNKYWTSEGIYEGCSACTEDQRNYQNGTANRPGPIVRDLLPGFRGDFRAFLGDRVRLYFHAIDRKLHLLGADSGYWQLDEESQLNYFSDGDPYIRRWELAERGAVTRSLSRVGSHLVLVTGDGTWIGAGPREVATFETSPPVDRATWEALGRQLRVALPPGEGGDPEELFRLNASAPVFLPGAVAWQFGLVDGRESFLLRLTDASPIESPFGSIAPADYLIRLSTDDKLVASPALPTGVVLQPPRHRGDNPIAGSPARAVVTLANEGHPIVRDATIMLNAALGDSSEQMVAARTITIPARGTASAELSWTPSAAGSWKLRAVFTDGATVVASEVATAEVSPSYPSDLATILQLQKLNPQASGAVTASLTLVISVAIGLGFAIWRVRARDQST